MQSTRRSFLRAAVIAPILTGAWVVNDLRTGKLKFRQRQIACCEPNEKPCQSCAHPASAKNEKPA